MGKRTCGIGGCKEPHKARGLCRRHYQRAKLAGELGGDVCTQPGCSDLQLARGVCRTHYNQMMRRSLFPGLPRCSSRDCGRAARAKGLCDAHRKRELRGIFGTDGPRFRNKGRECNVETCDRPAKTLGLCGIHYSRQYAGRELEPTPCCVSDCTRPRTGASASGLCAGHDQAARRYGSATEQGLRVGSLDRKGYRVIRIAGREYKEHRYLMEGLLGRPLLPGETVHHCNTVKDDNRIDGPLDAEFRSGNLQLWVSSQPSGGRVVDVLAHAIEIVERYAPELLARRPVQLRLA